MLRMCDMARKAVSSFLCNCGIANAESVGGEGVLCDILDTDIDAGTI